MLVMFWHRLNSRSLLEIFIALTARVCRVQKWEQVHPELMWQTRKRNRREHCAACYVVQRGQFICGSLMVLWGISLRDALTSTGSATGPWLALGIRMKRLSQDPLSDLTLVQWVPGSWKCLASCSTSVRCIIFILWSAGCRSKGAAWW